jgi:hypothetical protein
MAGGICNPSLSQLIYKTGLLSHKNVFYFYYYYYPSLKCFKSSFSPLHDQNKCLFLKKVMTISDVKKNH